MYFANNYIVGSAVAQRRFESFTTDGTSGYVSTPHPCSPLPPLWHAHHSMSSLRWPRGYLGPVSKARDDGLALEVPDATGNYSGAVLVVVDGAGAGQWRRISLQANNTYHLTYPLDPIPEPSANISVVPLRSNMLLVGNTVLNGTTLQLYVSARWLQLQSPDTCQSLTGTASLWTTSLLTTMATT